MTVKGLIKELRKVKDKDKKVVIKTFTEDWGYDLIETLSDPNYIGEQDNKVIVECR